MTVLLHLAFHLQLSLLSLCTSYGICFRQPATFSASIDHTRRLMLLHGLWIFYACSLRVRSLYRPRIPHRISRTLSSLLHKRNGALHTVVYPSQIPHPIITIGPFPIRFFGSFHHVLICLLCATVRNVTSSGSTLLLDHYELEVKTNVTSENRHDLQDSIPAVTRNNDEARLNVCNPSCTLRFTSRRARWQASCKNVLCIQRLTWMR